MLNHPASLFNIGTHEDKINLPAQKSPCTDYSTQHRLCGLLPFCLFERFLSILRTIPVAFYELNNRQSKRQGASRRYCV